MKWFITLLITAAVCTGCSGGGKPVSPTTSVTTMHEMVHVPAGPFEMGSTLQSGEQPVHTVELDGYYIDTYEVTNAQYEAYVTTGGGAASQYANNARYNGAQQPVVGYLGMTSGDRFHPRDAEAGNGYEQREN